VSLFWTIVDGATVFRWQESGGPPVEAPKRSGLGSRLLAKQSGLENVTLEFRPDGLVCEITVRDAQRQANEAKGRDSSAILLAPDIVAQGQG
jgi:two-component sensor histidine kinase